MIATERLHRSHTKQTRKKEKEKKTGLISTEWEEGGDTKHTRGTVGLAVTLHRLKCHTSEGSGQRGRPLGGAVKSPLSRTSKRLVTQSVNKSDSSKREWESQQRHIHTHRKISSFA